jgi:GNAT superfamily N-acetyltransferase
VTSPPAAPDSSAILLDRVLESLQWTLSRLADEVRPVESGWLVRTPSLPLVWTLNQLRLTEPITYGDGAALAEEHQSDLPYRHIVSLDEHPPARFEDAFAGAGWHVDREVLMALAARPERDVDTRAVVELTEEQMSALMRGWLVEEQHDRAAELDQVDEYNRREGRLWNERRFGVLDDRGLPVAITKLRSVDATAWVEDVYTVPESRGRGHARMLVTHAVDEARSAGHDLTFIVADDNDWPKHLYSEIGFRPIGVIRSFHRAVG